MRCLHESGHDLAGALTDQLLHPLNGCFIILTQPQLLLHTSSMLIPLLCQAQHLWHPVTLIVLLTSTIPCLGSAQN